MSDVPGTEWTVERIGKITDGDTLRIERTRLVELDARRYWLTDETAVAIRLVWVDTPERGDPQWAKAKADLTEWLSERWRHVDAGDMRVICYESAGWDRLLGDLLDADGNSASQWLMIEKGWPPYRA
jgi:endonuclease YncB( thermonuclease family)